MGDTTELGKVLCFRGHLALAGGRSGREFLERACALSSTNEIQVRDLPTQVYTPMAELSGLSHTGNGGIVPIEELEKQTILNALAQVNGDKILAARLLGIGKTTLYRKLKEYAQP